jgi:hypothetical protein
MTVPGDQSVGNGLRPSARLYRRLTLRVPVLKMVGEFEAGVKRHPLIEMAAIDRY